MNIIAQSKEFSKVEMYKMTRGAVTSVKDSVGAVIEPVAYLLYSDVNSRGEEVEILSIMTKDGEIFSATSKTFKEEFSYIWKLMDGEPFKISILDGTAKSGRTFVTCTLV